MRHLYAKILGMLPDDFQRGENLCFTINHNVTCHPHSDTADIGETLLMFLGDFTGGELHTERGECFTEKGMWHGYMGAEITPWNSPHVGETCSVIVHNNKQPITWGAGRRAPVVPEAPQRSGAGETLI